MGAPTARPATGATATLTPRDDGLTIPSPWARHERTLMTWPPAGGRWGARLAAARAEYAAVARAVAAFEPVLLIAARGEGAAARDACGAAVDVLELPIDDAGVRDAGPVFLLGAGGRRGAADFKFNGWGRSVEAFERDAQLGERLCAALGIPRYPIPLVVEGGAFTVDGLGTLIASEEALLHSSRNPTLGRDDVERRLRSALGVDRIIWLRGGLARTAAGHGAIDGVCAFVAPGRVLVQTARAGLPAADALGEDRRRLEAALDVRGQHLEVVELELEGPDAVPAAGLYQANGALVVPVAGRDPDHDAETLRRVAAACPDREVVTVPGTTLHAGGVGPNRIALGQPAPLAD